MLELGATALERKRFRFSRRHLGRRARHLQLGDVARAPAPLGEGERLSISGERVAHDPSFGVERTQREIDLRHLRLDEKAGALQQAFARLRVEHRRLVRVREPAKKVDLVGEIDARGE